MKTDLIMKRLPVEQLKPAKYNPRKDLKPGDTVEIDGMRFTLEGDA